LDLELHWGCSGMTAEETARSDEQFENLLIDCVWDADSSEETTIGQLRQFLMETTTSLHGDQLKRVILGISPQRFRTFDDVHLVGALGHCIEEFKAVPVFLAIADPAAPDESSSIMLPKHRRNARAFVRHWFVDEELPLPAGIKSPYQHFLAI